MFRYPKPTPKLLAEGSSEHKGYIDDEIQPGQLYRDYNKLGGGFKYVFIVIPKFGEMI